MCILCRWSGVGGSGVGAHNGHEIRKRGRLRIIGRCVCTASNREVNPLALRSLASPPHARAPRSPPPPSPLFSGPIDEGDENRGPAGDMDDALIRRRLRLAARLYTRFCARARSAIFFFFFLLSEERRKGIPPGHCRTLLERARRGFFSWARNGIPRYADIMPTKRATRASPARCRHYRCERPSRRLVEKFCGRARKPVCSLYMASASGARIIYEISGDYGKRVLDIK